MSEPTQPAATPPANQPANTPPADGKPAETPAAPSTVDLAKLEGAELEKVLENPNLWHLPRIKELRDAKAAHDKLLKEQAQAEEKTLEEQNKHKELAEKRATDLAAANAKIQEMTVNQQLMTKLTPLGVVDLDGALKLIDRSKIAVDDSGNVTGVDEAIEALKTDKAYLFNANGGTQPKLGAPSNGQTPPNGAPMKFKRSQLQDPAFYKANEKEIEAAYKAGLIEDDISR